MILFNILKISVNYVTFEPQYNTEQTNKISSRYLTQNETFIDISESFIFLGFIKPPNYVYTVFLYMEIRSLDLRTVLLFLVLTVEDCRQTIFYLLHHPEG